MDIKVECLGHYMDDLWVANVARVSMGKWHPEFTGGDKELIQYLADHGHWSPFAHPQLTFRITAPIFTARQLQKHTVGFAWNETSRRYVDDTPEFFIPDARKRAPNVKQGSSDELVEEIEVQLGDEAVYLPPRMVFEAHYEDSLKWYESMLKSDVAPEVARAILPQGMMTQWIWTGSLYGFARVCNLRLDSHAQREAHMVAREIFKAMDTYFPISSKALVKGKYE